MKKQIAVVSVLLILLTLCACKGKTETAPETTVYTTESFPYTYETHTVSPEDATAANPEGGSEAQQNPATKPAQNGTTAQNQSVTKKEAVTKEGVVTYYSDNPNNKYIQTVSKKFGVDPSHLIALIKTNAEYPGATVLQFDGSRDSQGKLITTNNTLQYIYDVQDNGTVNKSNKDGTDTYGYSKLAGMTAYMLAEKYMVPSLDNYKKNMVYEDYFGG